MGANGKWSFVVLTDACNVILGLMTVGLFFRLMMDVEDVGGKWIEYESRRKAISAS